MDSPLKHHSHSAWVGHGARGAQHAGEGQQASGAPSALPLSSISDRHPQGAGNPPLGKAGLKGPASVLIEPTTVPSAHLTPPQATIFRRTQHSHWSLLHQLSTLVQTGLNTVEDHRPEERPMFLSYYKGNLPARKL